MRVFAVFLCLLPMPAFAHWGHLGEVAGHGHWIGLAAGAAAAAAAAWGLRGRKDDVSEEEAEPEDDEELAEA